MNQDNNRLLLELERSMRAINREAINPRIQALTIDGLRPLLALVAGARARYLGALFDLASTATDGRPDEAELEGLSALRREYEELASGAKALETAIQRGYLDVQPGGH
jgi:hypothetical protein